MMDFFANWKPALRVFADVQCRWTMGSELDLIARTPAQIYAMAYEQPVL